MKLALHRSIAFWSGLLLLVFICWAWWESSRRPTYFVHGAMIANHHSGGLDLGYSLDTTGDFVGSTNNPDPHLEWRAPHFSRRPRDVFLFIPHWLVLLAVAAPWLGLLFWRAKRRAAASPENSQLPV